MKITPERIALLRRVADFLESHGRDEGGYSHAVRAEFQREADELRAIARDLESQSRGDDAECCAHGTVHTGESR